MDKNKNNLEDVVINKKSVNEIIILSKNILKIFYLILIVLGTYLFLKIIKELRIIGVIVSLLKILAPLFIGVVIAWLINPFVTKLEHKKVRRIIGATAAYAILIGAIILLVQAIIPLLYNQTVELVSNFPNIFDSMKKWLENLLSNFDSKLINIETIESTLFTKLDEFSSNLSTSLPSILINLLSSLVSSIGIFIIGMVIGFFLLLSCNNLGNTLLEIIPKRFRRGTKELVGNIDFSLRSYVNGALIDAFVVFTVSSLAFWILGLKSPLLFGLFCGLMNVIPYAGPYIGGAPAVVVGFSQSIGLGIAVLIAIAIIQTIEGNILQTIIISKTTKLNPVTIIIGLLIFGHFFGIIGMLLSTPIISVIKVIIKYFDDKYEFIKI